MNKKKNYSIKIKASTKKASVEYGSVFDYQKEAVENLTILDKKFPDYYSTLVVIPTGGGKTRVAVEYLYQNVLNRAGQKVLWIAQRLLLLEQAYNTFKNLADKNHLPDKMESEVITRLVSSRHGQYDTAGFNRDVDLVIITQQTLEKKIDRDTKIVETMNDWLKGAEGLTIIIDEAHHATEAPYKAILSSLLKMRKNNVFKACHIIGLTATPKGDGNDDIEEIFSFGVMDEGGKKYATGETSYAYQISIHDLVSKNVLSLPYMANISCTDEDRDKIIVSTYLKGMESIEFYDGRIGVDCAKQFEGLSDSFGQTILFARSRMHALELEKMFREAKVECGLAISLDAEFGKKISKEKEQSLEDFLGMTLLEKKKQIEADLKAYQSGNLKLIITAEMLLEGVDYPKTQTVFIAKDDTVDCMAVTQMVGRALRGIYQGGTPTAFIISFGKGRLEKILWEIPESYQEKREGTEFSDEMKLSTLPKAIEPPLIKAGLEEWKWDDAEKERFLQSCKINEESCDEVERVVRESALYQYVITAQEEAFFLPIGYYMLGRKSLLVWSGMELWTEEIRDKIDTCEIDREDFDEQCTSVIRSVIDSSPTLQNGKKSVKEFLPEGIVDRYIRHFLRYYVFECGSSKSTFTKETQLNEFQYLKNYDLSGILMESINIDVHGIESHMDKMWKEHDEIHDTWHDEDTFKRFLRPKIQRLNNIVINYADDEDEDEPDDYFFVRLYRNGRKRGDLCMMLRQILTGLSGTCQRFVDVFGGTGAVTAQMQDMFDERIYNEFDEHLANFVYCVSDSTLGSTFDKFCYDKICERIGSTDETISDGIFAIQKEMEQAGYNDKDIITLSEKIEALEKNTQGIREEAEKCQGNVSGVQDVRLTNKKIRMLRDRYLKMTKEKQMLQDSEVAEIVKKYIASYYIAKGSMEVSNEDIRTWLNGDETTDYDLIKEKAFQFLFYHSFKSDKTSGSSITGIDSEGIRKFNESLDYKNKKSWLTEFHARMNKVQVMCSDFRDILRNYQDTDTVYYLDPPYFLTKQYNAKFSDGNHLDMLEWLRETKSKWILSCKSEATNQSEVTDWDVRIGEDRRLIYVEDVLEDMPKMDEYFKAFLYPMQEMDDSRSYLERVGYKDPETTKVYKANVQPDMKRKDALFVYSLKGERHKEIMISNIEIGEEEKKIFQDKGINIQRFEDFFHFA